MDKNKPGWSETRFSLDRYITKTARERRQPEGASSGSGGGMGWTEGKFSLDRYLGEREILSGRGWNEEAAAWSKDLADFSERMSADYAARRETYQSADRFYDYRLEREGEMDELIRRARETQAHYTDYADTYDRLYGAGSADRALAGLREGTAYLEELRDSLRDEGQYWGQWGSAEEYDKWKTISTMDTAEVGRRLEAERQDLYALKDRVDEAQAAIPQYEENPQVISAIMAAQEEYNTLNSLYQEQQETLRRQNQELRQAEQYQTLARYAALPDSPDFETLSRQGAESGDGFFNAPAFPLLTGGRDEVEKLAARAAATEEQRAIYHYLLAKEGEEAAGAYLDAITPVLNAKSGQAVGGAITDLPVPDRVPATLAMGVYAGLDQFGRGVAQIFVDEPLDPGVAAYASQTVREGLSSAGPEFFGSSLGQAAYDAVTSTANMAPSILLSYLTAGLGAPVAVASAVGVGALGASAGGNAYGQAMAQGYTQEQAANYGLLVGVSEAGLQYLLGGIGKLGGALTGKAARAISNIDKALLRVGADLGVHLASEGVEEYLQEILDPVWRNLLLDEDNEIKLVSEDAAYALLLGVVTAGLLEGGHIVTADLNLNKIGGAIRDAGKYETLLENALALPEGSKARTLAQELRGGSRKATSINVGELFAAYAREGGDLTFLRTAQDGPSGGPDAGESAPGGPAAGNGEAGGADAVPADARAVMERLLSGEEISRNQASKIARSGAAVAELSRRTGVEINTEAPISALKTDIQALSRPAARSAAAPRQPETGASVRARQVLETAENGGFGESGRRAFVDGYDGGADTAAYYAGFSALYNAGLAGLDEGGVKGPYAAALTPAQRYEAYAAGQNDAAESLRAELARAPEATVYGAEAGFIENEYSAALPKKTARFYDAMGKATGTRIMMAAPTGEGGPDGWYENGIVYIASDAGKAGTVVAKHEITHHMQEVAPEQYRAYRNYAMRMLAGSDGSVSSLVERYRARYTESGVNLTAEQAMDEIASDFTMELLLRPDRFTELAREDRSAAGKLLEAIKDFIAKVKAFFRGDKTAQDSAVAETYGVDLATLEEAARLWDNAYDAVVADVQRRKSEGQEAKTQKNATQEGGASLSLKSKNPYDGKALASDSTVYSYDFLTSLPDMQVTMLPEVSAVRDAEGKVDTSKAVTAGIRNARNAGAERDGNVFVRNRYTGKQLQVTTSSIRHGLNGGMNRLLTNARLGAVIGDVVKNAVPINALHDKAKGVTGTYAMAAYAADRQGREFVAIVTVEQRAGSISGIEAYDVTHAVSGRQKRGQASDPHTRSRDFTLSNLSEISIKDLLKVVNTTHQSILSEDVLARLGETRNPDGEYTEQVKFSLKSTDDNGDTELRLSALRQERDSLTEQLDDPFSERSSEELREIRNRLIKVQHEIDVIAESERRAAVRTPLSTIVEQLGRYRRSDLESLAEQISDGAWDGYEELDRAELEDALREALDERMAEMSPLEVQAPRLGLYVRPVSAESGRASARGSGGILRENAALQNENRLLQERLEHWKSQVKRSDRGKVDRKAVEQTARALVSQYSSEADVSEIAGDLQRLYDYMTSGRDASGDLSGEEAVRRANEIGRKLVENAVVQEDESYRQYQDLREYARATRLTISETDSHDIPDFGEFRKRNFGRINLASGETNIDQVYGEMAQRWPEFFDETSETHPADQLQRIADVLDEIYRIEEVNPFGSYLSDAVSDASNEIMERFFDVPQVKKTFADRQAAKLNEAKAAGRRKLQEQREKNDARLSELRQQNRERMQRQKLRERETRERQLERLRSRYAARDAAGRERRSARELRARIMRHTADLSRKLLRPSDKQHIPDQLRTAVAAMLDAINLESTYTVDQTSGKRRKGGDGGPTRRTEEFLRLREAYDSAIQEGADLVLDPDLLENLNAIVSMRNIPIASMNTEQLTTVWNAIRAVEASVRSAGRAFALEKGALIEAQAEAFRRFSKTRRPRSNKLDKARRSLDLEKPITFFHHFGEQGKKMFRALQAAEFAQNRMTSDVTEQARKIAGYRDIERLKENVRTYALEKGGHLTLSKDQAMEIYLLSMREAGLRHLLAGGVVQPAVEKAKIGRGNVSMKLTEKDIADIISSLTQEEMNTADAFQAITTNTIAEYANAASMAVYNYRKFTEEHYWPIHTSKEEVKSEQGNTDGMDMAIRNTGAAKALVPNAQNAVDIRGVFDTFASHTVEMTTYAAWLAVMEDMNRLFNFRFQVPPNSPQGETFKGIVENLAGNGGQAYWKNLMGDIQTGMRRRNDNNLTPLVQKFFGNAKAASVGANFRVVLQQPTAYSRAGMVLTAADLSAGLAKGKTRGNGWKKALKYSDIARIKRDGSFDIGKRNTMYEEMFERDGALDRLDKFTSWGARTADAMTWGKLWNASEHAVARKNKALTVGSDAYFNAVAELFTDVINETQVVDGVLQRAQIMRSENAWAQEASSFMGEPIASLNMVMRAYEDLRYSQETVARRHAIRIFSRAVSVFVANAALNALAQSFADALRDDDRDKDFMARFWSAYTGVNGDEESIIEAMRNFVLGGNIANNLNPLGAIPYVNDVLSVFQGFTVERMDISAISDLIQAAQKFIQSSGGRGKNTTAYAFKELASAAAKVCGISVTNIFRDMWGIARTLASDVVGDIGVEYFMEKSIYNLSNSTNRSRFFDLLYEASLYDREVYETIYADMVASGITEDQIRTGMESRMKAAQGVESVSDLDRRYLSPDQERSYDRLHSQVSGTAVWREANAEQREVMEDAIYALTAGTTGGTSMREKISGGAAYGISEADYILYLAAKEIADAENEDPEKRNGSIDQEEAKLAIDMLDGLSDEARAYLWQITSAGWNDANNPYR